MLLRNFGIPQKISSGAPFPWPIQPPISQLSPKNSCAGPGSALGHWAMGKRASNGNASARASKKAKGGDDGLAELVDQQQDAIASLPWWEVVMTDLETMLAKYRNMSAYFMETFPTKSDRVDFAAELAEAFPLPDGETLSSDYTPGVKQIAIWQTCFHVQGGNRGLVIAEYFKNLVQLVFLRGCRTDASKMPGVEYPVIQPLIEGYFDVAWESEKVMDDTFEAQTVGFVKGWTRCLAFLTCAHLIIKHDLVDFYRDKMPSEYASFCIIKALVPEGMQNEVDRIAANRGYLVEPRHYMGLCMSILGILYLSTMDYMWVLLVL